jgi:hypothetical protein
MPQSPESRYAFVFVGRKPLGPTGFQFVDESLKLVFDLLHVSRFRSLIPETFNAKELVINRKLRHSTVPKVDLDPAVWQSEPSERSHRNYVLLARQSMRISFLCAFSAPSWNHTVPDYVISAAAAREIPARWNAGFITRGPIAKRSQAHFG